MYNGNTEMICIRAQQMMGSGGTPDLNEMMNNPEMMKM
jgi:hypothetical protein